MRFRRFTFDPKWQFRGALSRFYELFPEQFRTRIERQGLWMPFAKISEVKGWQDFGFRFKEGNNETRWDDEHDIITFRYTEPMTWWMSMPKEMPRTLERPSRRRNAWPAFARTPRLCSPAAIMTSRASSSPGCSTRPGATARSGA